MYISNNIHLQLLIICIQNNRNIFQTMKSQKQPPADSKKIQNYIYRFCDRIGTGNFSKVYKGTNELTNAEIAIKTIEFHSINTERLKQLLNTETLILKMLTHPNIIACLQILSSFRNCYIIMELCNGGDLETKLKKQGHLAEEEMYQVVIDVYEGLKYLSKKNIVHRDIKASNIFIHNGIYKIADFGFAQISQKQFTDISVGSPIYMSPEGFINNVYGAKTDIWAFGVMLYELVESHTPCSSSRSEEQLKNNLLKQIDIKSFKSNISQELKQLIILCLTVNVKDRISIDEIQGCEWVRKARQILSRQRQTLNRQRQTFNKQTYNKQTHNNKQTQNKNTTGTKNQNPDRPSVQPKLNKLLNTLSRQSLFPITNTPSSNQQTNNSTSFNRYSSKFDNLAHNNNTSTNNNQSSLDINHQVRRNNTTNKVPNLNEQNSSNLFYSPKNLPQTIKQYISKMEKADKIQKAQKAQKVDKAQKQVKVEKVDKNSLSIFDAAGISDKNSHNLNTSNKATSNTLVKQANNKQAKSNFSQFFESHQQLVLKKNRYNKTQKQQEQLESQEWQPLKQKQAIYANKGSMKNSSNILDNIAQNRDSLSSKESSKDTNNNNSQNNWNIRNSDRYEDLKPALKNNYISEKKEKPLPAGKIEHTTIKKQLQQQKQSIEKQKQKDKDNVFKNKDLNIIRKHEQSAYQKISTQNSHKLGVVKQSEIFGQLKESILEPYKKYFHQSKEYASTLEHHRKSPDKKANPLNNTITTVNTNTNTPVHKQKTQLLLNLTTVDPSPPHHDQQPSSLLAITKNHLKFSDCIGIIHYCRLCYKLATMLDSTADKQSQAFFTDWSIKLLSQLVGKIKSDDIIYGNQSLILNNSSFPINQVSSADTQKKKKLKDVTQQYLKKYTPQSYINTTATNTMKQACTYTYDTYLAKTQALKTKIKENVSNVCACVSYLGMLEKETRGLMEYNLQIRDHFDGKAIEKLLTIRVADFTGKNVELVRGEISG